MIPWKLHGSRLLLQACLLLAGGTPALAQNPAPRMRELPAPRMRELIALSDPAAVQASPTVVPGIDLRNVPLADSPDLHDKLAALLGQPVGPDLLQTVKTLILERYRAQGRPYLDVGFPQQDVTDGVLQVVVTEFRIGAVNVAGNAWFSDSLIRRRTGLQPGATVDQAALDKRLAQLNGPFVQVTPEFKAGTQPGTTDVTLRTADHFPVRFTAGYDNSGAPSTGYDRWQLGANWIDPLLTGQTFFYQFTSSADFYQHRPQVNGRTAQPAFTSHAGGWQVPLPWGDSLTLAGSYTQQNPNLGPDLGSLGITETAGIQYVRPLDPLRIGSFAPGGTQAVSLSYDFKRTNNDLSFGGVSVSSGFSDISEFSLRYDLTVPDPFGLTSVQNTGVISPGKLTPYNNDESFQPSAANSAGTVGAKARYMLDRLVVSRLTPLPKGFGFLLRATGQASNQTLLPIEQLSIAGIDSVRGYQEGSITTSTGFVTNVELSSPAFSPSFGLLGPRFADTAQLHVFYDYGQGFNANPTQTLPAKFRTASLGVGGRYDVGTNLSVRVEQGFQLVRQLRQGANGAFAHLSVQLTW